MDVSIIIINYNSFTLTCNCIRSIIHHTVDVRYEIILVDNGSTECNSEEFLNEFPGIILLKSSANGGFAYGNNLGIQRAQGEYVLLLNSDTILLEDSVKKCLACFKSYEHAGVLGCRMVYPDGHLQYTARKFRSIGWELLDLFRFIPLLIPYRKRSRMMLGQYFKCDETIECDWVNGAFFMFEKKILTQLPGGKLDDRFFMYGEDQLWCLQIKNLGYKIIFYSGTTIIHISNASTDPKKLARLRRIMMKHELEIMKLRKGPGLVYFLFTLIYGTKEMFRNTAKLVVFAATGRKLR
jgi:GT2 family glycosyltransferase